MIYVFLADGFEEAEALVTVDVLRRAGYDVKTVGVTGEFVTGTHSITVKSDIGIDDVTPEDCLEAIVLPGGIPGTPNLEKNAKVREFITFAAQNKIVTAAICAAPSILGKMGLLEGRAATCYPGFEEHLHGAQYTAEPVCISDPYVTANGAGAVFSFAFAVADVTAWYTGKKKYGDFSLSDNLKESMQCAL